MKKILRRISNFFRGAAHIAGTLVGVKWKGEWTYEGLVIAGWIFLLGVPFGILVAGPAFSLLAWLISVLIVLMIINLDDALVMMSNYLTYGIDGEQVSPYEDMGE